MTMKYSEVVDSATGASTLTIFLDGEMYIVGSVHPNFDTIKDKILADDSTDLVPLFDIEKDIKEKFERVSERVAIIGGEVTFDGDVVDNALTKQIVRFRDEKLDFTPLVNFFEKVQTNPNKHSRKQLFRWLDRHEFTLHPDGDVLMYKSVYSTPTDGLFLSCSSGHAIVNGVAHNGRIPQSVGDVVEMPRKSVQHDPSVGCHTGLHAGEYSYAVSFSGNVILSVKVNPRDVVSVPTDCEDRKVRTCRYTVFEVIETKYDSALYEDYSDGSGYDADDDDWIEDDDTCDCGCVPLDEEDDENDAPYDQVDEEDAF